MEIAARLFKAGKVLQKKVAAGEYVDNHREVDTAALRRYEKRLLEVVEYGTHFGMLFSRQMGYLSPNINPGKVAKANDLRGMY